MAHVPFWYTTSFLQCLVEHLQSYDMMDSDRIQLDMESSTCRVPKSPWTGAPFSQKLFFKSISSSSLHVYTLHVSPGTLALESQVHSVILLLGLVIGSPYHLCPPLIPNISGSSGSYGSSRRTTWTTSYLLQSPFLFWTLPKAGSISCYLLHGPKYIPRWGWCCLQNVKRPPRCCAYFFAMRSIMWNALSFHLDGVVRWIMASKMICSFLNSQTC